MKPYRRYGLFLLVLAFVLALAGCERSLSTPPANTGSPGSLEATPTIVGEIPTAMTSDPMSQLMAFSTQTAMAVETMTAMASDEEPTPTPEPPTPTPTPVVVVEVSPTPEPVVVPPEPIVPSSYVLQKGEYPYCLARRFNIDPAALLAANGLSNAQGNVFYPGLTLTIPQNAAPFPGERSLRSHPDLYTVQSVDETIYSIACLYGDVDPMVLAEYNDLSEPYTLIVGQVLEIP